LQIDYHHAVTYVVARLAGFPHIEARKVAYAAQYVDDADNDGVIRFDNGAMYSRISSAHHMLDYRNSNTLKNRRVWLPFHFLPGNGGLPAGREPRGRFYRRLVCVADSLVARDMLAACMADKQKPYGLHRLGIAMHVYADTWAHQGFAGVNHRINKAGNIRSQSRKGDARLLAKLANYFLSRAFPLGHGAVLSYPDRPYVNWSYINGMGKNVVRNNPIDFVAAADHMCRAMQRWMRDDPEAAVDGLPPVDKQKIATLLKTLNDEDGQKRHAAWLEKIAAGHFSFGPAKLSYVPKGRHSWKHRALGTLEWVDDPQGEPFVYKRSFLTSDWKMFHDALQAHRFDVIHDILPVFGICVV
jgi:hypothetical protein